MLDPGRATAVAALAGLLGTGCDGEDPQDVEMSPPMPSPLVTYDGWVVADPTTDVYADLRPTDVECDEVRGVNITMNGGEPHFEINTGWCNYVTVTQPILEPLDPGDSVEIRIFHFELYGAPAEAYLGIAIGGQPLWEKTIPIPSGGELVTEQVEVSDPVDAGTPLQFHVHNHGINTWEIYAIDRLSSGS